MFCTPSYALHLAEVGAQNQIDVSALQIRCIVVAGEPGGSIPAVRQRIEQAWNARVIDHGGATEVGPWGYAMPDGQGLYVVESEFLAEFLSVDTGQPAADGELSELVLTTLGRGGCPVIRYRTGDLVRPTWNAPGDNRFVVLQGGVLGRADDMMIVRGVNIFPSSVEQIIHSFPEIVEYRMLVHKQGAMDALTIEIEDRLERSAARGRGTPFAAGTARGGQSRAPGKLAPLRRQRQTIHGSTMTRSTVHGGPRRSPPPSAATGFPSPVARDRLQDHCELVE